MWRRFGDQAFSVLVAVVITIEAVPLAILTFQLARSATGLAGPSDVRGILIGTLFVSSLGLATVTGYTLAYQSISARHERMHADRRSRWVGRWLDVLYLGVEPPTAPIPRAAAEALLEIRETLKGVEGDRVAALIDRYDVYAYLDEMVRTGKLYSRLDAVDELAKARIPAALPALVRLLGDPEPSVRVAAARAGVRTLATVPEGEERVAAAHDLAWALEKSELPRGALSEVLLLGDDAAPLLVGELLFRIDAPPNSLKVGLDAAARLQLVIFGEEAARFVAHPDPEVRAAAFRVFWSIGYVSDEAAPAIVAALTDPVEFVRIHAARAAAFLPVATAIPALWECLGEPSWWVRRAAAVSLLRLGEAGRAQLESAAEDHPDRYARDMARQVLRDDASSGALVGGQP